MKVYLECLVVVEGKMTRNRFLLEDIPVEQYDYDKHWTTKYAWEELYKPESSEGNIRVSKIKDSVRVWITPEFTPEEKEFLLKAGKIQTLTDLPDNEKTQVTYGNQTTGSSL